MELLPSLLSRHRSVVPRVHCHPCITAPLTPQVLTIHRYYTLELQTNLREVWNSTIIESGYYCFTFKNLLRQCAKQVLTVYAISNFAEVRLKLYNFTVPLPLMNQVHQPHCSLSLHFDWFLQKNIYMTTSWQGWWTLGLELENESPQIELLQSEPSSSHNIMTFYSSIGHRMKPWFCGIGLKVYTVNRVWTLASLAILHCNFKPIPQNQGFILWGVEL